MLKMCSSEVTIDAKGRILIPEGILEKAKLRRGGEARLEIVDGKLVITRLILPQEFIQEMEGCITEGKPKLEPLSLKKTWKTNE